MSLRTLGSHTLKGLAQPEEIFQVLHPEILATFPPLRGSQVRRVALAGIPTTLVGRDREVQAITTLLTATDTQLVTITGPGGVGKTRLAQAIATRLQEVFRQGAVFVSLAAIHEPEQVLLAVAQALDLHLPVDHPTASALSTTLRDQELLLVLDNFEQVATAAPEVASLLAACATVRVLATSRAPLQLQGEREFSLAPLALPDPRRAITAEYVRGSPAVSLFVQHVQGRRPDFALDDGNAPVVVDLCRRLDGLPLAIELVAARIKMLSLQSLLAQVQSRLLDLPAGTMDLPDRQRTLQTTLDWSYDLLDDVERLLFRRLAMFAGGWTLEAAEFVCADATQIPAWEVFDLLSRLIDRSLVVPELDGDQSGILGRFSLLEIVRQYGMRCLGESERAMTGRRHMEWFAMTARQAMAQVDAGVQGATQMLISDRANLQEALAWARTQSAERDQIEALSAAVRWLALGAMGGARRRERPLPEVLTRQHP
jgi:predicted ATPase